MLLPAYEYWYPWSSGVIFSPSSIPRHGVLHCPLPRPGHPPPETPHTHHNWYRHSYQPSRFLLEYPTKIQLIPLSRISTSNSHILGCALARPAQPIAIAISSITRARPVETLIHKRIVTRCARVFVIFPLERSVHKFIIRFVGQSQRHLQHAAASVVGLLAIAAIASVLN